MSRRGSRKQRGEEDRPRSKAVVFSGDARNNTFVGCTATGLDDFFHVEEGANIDGLTAVGNVHIPPGTSPERAAELLGRRNADLFGTPKANGPHVRGWVAPDLKWKKEKRPPSWPPLRSTDEPPTP